MKTVNVGEKIFYVSHIEFDNGYTASIISHDRSYGGDSGLFEVGVLYDGILVYDTPVTHDTVGLLDFADVADILKKIETLPKRK